MLKTYIKSLKETYDTRDYLEHSYRTQLETLLKSYIDSRNLRLTVIHEPVRDVFGAPDFKIIDRANNVIGYIECKDINININSRSETETRQMKKYLSISNNIILTNYKDFILFKNKEMIETCCIVSSLDIRNPRLIQEDQFFEMLLKFFLHVPDQITDSRILSVELANRTKILKEAVLEEYNKNEKDNSFKKFYNVFKATIITDLSKDDFADMYAQIIGIGLLFLRLSKEEKITKGNILSEIPKYVPLLKDFFPMTNFDEWDSDVLWILDDIIFLINSIDRDFVKEALSYKKMSLIKKRDLNLQDPFLNFYELFLTTYDRVKKDKLGVYYTPESVVSFIIRNLDFILKEKIAINEGFLKNDLKVLDFACGTGTFILTLIDYIKLELEKSHRSNLFKSEIRDHILKNVYGFEILMVPYIISHLRIHEFLESYDYDYQDNQTDRARIYLTNTLTNVRSPNTNFLMKFDDEANNAFTAKNQTDIMVIMGNPPYSNYSQNKSKDGNNFTWIGEKIQIYKPKGEKKLNLDDDYIKFIRFACWKLERVSKGVIGIITNNSFLSGITHRKMRKELINMFDEIYILNLHGNGNIGEMCPDGSVDDNVFNIRDAGVNISFFIKKDNTKNKQAKIFYSDLYGKKNYKYNYLYDNDIQNIDFEELNYNEFNSEFSTTKWGKTTVEINHEEILLFGDGWNFFSPSKSMDLIKKYGEFWGIKDIFDNAGTGIKTERDNLSIHFDEESIRTVIDDFNTLELNELRVKYVIKADSRDWSITRAKDDVQNNYQKNLYTKILYRPFDFRYTFYTGTSRGFIGTPSYNISKNFKQDNLGIVFKRQFKDGVKFNYAFVTDKMSESCLFESAYANNSCAPLYIYPDELLKDENRIVNFTDKFSEFIAMKYSSDTPEEILYYIYAVLFSPTYREKYEDLLRLDFPRIPFTDDMEVFNKLKKLGKRLASIHLLKERPTNEIARFECTSQDFLVTKSVFIDDKVWINDSVCFSNISEEIWKYEIGGYQVLQKWLDYRKKAEYTLTNTDLKHFMRIVDVLGETIELQVEIDELTREWI